MTNEDKRLVIVQAGQQKGNLKSHTECSKEKPRESQSAGRRTEKSGEGGN